MKPFYYFFIALFAVSCNGELDSEPCDAISAPAPCEAILKRLECMNMPRPKDSYNYPLCPGMDEWADLHTSVAMGEACSVPECLLKKMSTQAVIQAIWERPVGDINERFGLGGLPDYWSAKNWAPFSTCLELENRKDAGKALLERLILVNPIPQYAGGHESQALEWLFAQSVFISQLNKTQQRKVVEICLKNDELRQKSPLWEEYSMFRWLRTTAFVLMGRTMLAADYSPFVKAVNENEELKFFIDGWIDGGDPLGVYDNGGKAPYSYRSIRWIDSGIPAIIINHAKNYIK